MGLWREHFHPSVLLGWGVLGWIVGCLLAVSAIVLVFGQYVLANICFAVTATFIFAKIIQLAVFSQELILGRVLFTFVLFGVVGVLIVETVRGVNRFAASKKSGTTATATAGSQPFSTTEKTPPLKESKPEPANAPNESKPAIPSPRTESTKSPPFPAPEGSLRMSSSAEVRQMFEFLDERHRQAPNSPDTLPLFRHKFGNQLAALRDEFAQYGLSDSLLDVTADPGRPLSATHEGIKKLLDSINKMSQWLPVEEPYRETSDADVAARILSVAKNVSERANRAYARLTGPEPPDGVRFHFLVEYRDCCLNAVRDLRGVCIKRLGPPIDSDESQAFRDLMDVMTGTSGNSGSIAVTLDYAPHLQQLGERLKEKSQLKSKAQKH